MKLMPKEGESMSKDELLEITGGGISASAIVVGIGAFITFIIGAIDGYLRPRKCE